MIMVNHNNNLNAISLGCMVILHSGWLARYLAEWLIKAYSGESGVIIALASYLLLSYPTYPVEQQVYHAP